MAACSGVTWTLRWPMQLCSKADASGMSPMDDGATDSGTDRLLPSMPNSAASSSTSDWLTLSWHSPANAVLHEIVKASSNVSVGPLPQLSPPKFCIVPPSVSGSTLGALIVSPGLTPAFNAAAATTTLKIEPG